MTRDEAIHKLEQADGAEGKLFNIREGKWARALVLSLEILGVLKFNDEKKEDKDGGL